MALVTLNSQLASNVFVNSGVQIGQRRGGVGGCQDGPPCARALELEIWDLVGIGSLGFGAFLIAFFLAQILSRLLIAADETVPNLIRGSGFSSGQWLRFDPE